VSEPGTTRAPASAGRLLVIAGLFALLTAAVAGACSLAGQADLSFTIWKLRIFRLTNAAVVGAALATGGMALQALLRNPLAEPYILGISSGAGVGVLIGLAAGGCLGLASWATTPILALVGAVLTCTIVYTIAQRRGRLDPYALLLSGVIVNAFNGAVMLTIFMLVPPRVITSYAGWAMGRLTDSVAISAGWLMGVCVLAVAAGWLAMLLRAAAFNALGLGDDVAATVGVSVHWLRVETFLVVSLMTAAAVALAGPIGFLGLIVPHIARLVVGPDHRRLAVVCGFGGAIFLMAADTLCRTAGDLIRIGEMPVGIVTALCGGPFFIFLLRRKFREAPA